MFSGNLTPPKKCQVVLGQIINHGVLNRVADESSGVISTPAVHFRSYKGTLFSATMWIVLLLPASDIDEQTFIIVVELKQLLFKFRLSKTELFFNAHAIAFPPLSSKNFTID